jgi:transposase-like protein
MKTVKQRIQKRRKFTEEFKLHIVREFESGKFSVKELSILYRIPLTNLFGGSISIPLRKNMGIE